MGRVVFAIVGVVAVVAIVLVVVNPFAESEQDKALTAVCSAKADIQKQVDSLKTLTPATFTTQQVQDAVKAIGDDLSTIQDNLPTVTEQSRSQITTANQRFRAEFLNVAGQVARSITAKDAAAQLKSSFADLASAYQQAYQSVKCPA